MFIIIALVVVGIALLLAGKITLLKSYGSQERVKASFARETFDAITACNKQEVLDESLLGACLLPPPGVKAVRLYQPAFSGCDEKSWGDSAYQAALLGPDAESFPYWVSVKQTSGGLVCLAQLSIVV